VSWGDEVALAREADAESAALRSGIAIVAGNKAGAARAGVY